MEYSTASAHFEHRQSDFVTDICQDIEKVQAHGTVATNSRKSPVHLNAPKSAVAELFFLVCCSGNLVARPSGLPFPSRRLLYVTSGRLYP